MNNKKYLTKKSISFLQIAIMLVSTFAFLYFISFDFAIAIPEIKAQTQSPVSTSCCKETLNGGICQTINSVDADLCKEAPIATSCDYVESCQPGCCYNPKEGICSLNSPKDKCIADGGNWSNSPKCEIPQCDLGCCVIGDSAMVTTNRECSIKTKLINLQPDFRKLDSSGSCNTYTNLNKQGACVNVENGFSGVYDCKFTTKGLCKTGNFYEGYLCTAKELKTNCRPSKQTTCLEGKDQIFYLDTCGNPANIYDASRYDDENYWQIVIDKKDSCSKAGKDCGNCDYLGGSVCSDYRIGKDDKPTSGNKVCRDLTCKTENGIKQNGESWCVSDYSTNVFGSAPVGSRFFVEKCIEGELSISPCADFNNEICIQKNTTGPSEAKCTMNDWRSCLSANEKESYSEVKAECDELDQCIMYNEISENSEINNLPGFKDTTNDMQGSAGNIGLDANKVISYCVPKYTPGMVFWSLPENGKKNLTASLFSSLLNTNNDSKIKVASAGDNYGGSLEETKAICSLGSFTCVSHKTRTCRPNDPNDLDIQSIIKSQLCLQTGGLTSLVAPNDVDCTPWQDEENWECSLDSANPNTNETVKMTIDALNERCAMIGPCGVKANIAGEMGSNPINNSVKRIKTSASGRNENASSEGYAPSLEYLNSAKTKSQMIRAGNLKSLIQTMTLPLITGKAITNTDSPQTTSQQASAQTQIEGIQNQANTEQISTIGSLTSTGTSLGTSGISSLLTTTVTIDSLMSIGGSQTLTSGAVIVNGQLIKATAQAPIYLTTQGGEIAVNSITLGNQVVISQSVQTTSNLGASILPSINAAGAQIVGAVLGMAAAYTIGKLILKNQNWSPGKSQQFIAGLMSYGAAAGTAIASVIVLMSSSSCATGIGCPIGIAVGIIIAVTTSIYTNCVDNSYEENEYVTLKYTCDAWQPPLKGDCSLCNNDIRTCSEYRCRSLGQNCQYYIENGEPGYCATINDIWSAQIKPWEEILNPEDKYTEVKDKSFKIESKTGQLVDGWTSITFGITTDKYAQCKIDNKHTASFDDMAVSMVPEVPAYSSQEAQNSIQGNYHKVVLSPNIFNSGFGQSTLGFSPGENNYYIRCKNFAGQVNEGEFVVKVIANSGKDITPPVIQNMIPASDSYVKKDANSSSVVIWLNEPSRCKYSQNINLLYEQMNDSFTCLTDSNSAILGNWPCYATIKNLNAGENKFFIKCQDLADKNSKDNSTKANTMENSKEYNLNVCNSGLTISTLTADKTTVISKSPATVEVKVSTTGCIENGKAICSYKFNNFGEAGKYIDFLNTNSNIHSQIFSDMFSGENSISIKCTDEVGNSDEKNITINVLTDNQAPIVLRSYEVSDRLVIITDENSSCSYIQNSTIGCTYNLEDKNINLTQMDGAGITHTLEWQKNQNYYIKCVDKYGNEAGECFKVKTY